MSCESISEEIPQDMKSSTPNPPRLETHSRSERTTTTTTISHQHPSGKSSTQHKKQTELERYFEFVKLNGTTTNTHHHHHTNSSCDINTIDPFGRRTTLFKINSNDPLLYFNKLCVAMQFSQLLSLKLFPNAKEITESFSAYYNIRDYLSFTKRQHLLSDHNVLCYVIADGNVPRTGATIACSTNWQVFSIDPRMKKKWQSQYCVPCEEEEKERTSKKKSNMSELVQHSPHTLSSSSSPIIVQDPPCSTCVSGLSSCSQIQRLYPLSQTTDEFLQSALFDKALKHLSPTLNVIIAVHSHADLWQFYKEIPNPKVCLCIPCCFQPNIPSPIAIFKDEALHSEKNVVYLWSS